MLFLVPVLLLAALLTFQYRDTILEKLRSAAAQEHSDEKTEDENNANSETQEHGKDKAQDSPDSQPGAENPDTGSGETSLTDDTAWTQINENDGGASMRSSDNQSSAPQTPTADTPTVDKPSPTAPSVDEPTVDTPTTKKPTVNSPISQPGSGLTDTGGSFSDLENYELKPYYGDSLTQ